MNYDVDYFIEKFEAIPEDKWITYNFIDDVGACCALGHCGMRWEQNLLSVELKVFIDVFTNAFDQSVSSINDGDDSKFQQHTPKQRVLAALYEIKSKEEIKEEIVEVKEELELV